MGEGEWAWTDWGGAKAGEEEEEEANALSFVCLRPKKKK